MIDNPVRTPNNSFKPTPHRGVGHVLYATLAHVRRPAAGRLNSGVRRQKNVRFPPPLCLSLQPSHSLPRLCRSQLLRSFFFGNHALLRSVCRARSNFAGVTCVGIGNAGWLSVSLSAPDAVASETPGKFAGRARVSPLRLSEASAGFILRWHPPPPNNSFKPTPCRGVSRVLLRYASTRPPPRHGSA